MRKIVFSTLAVLAANTDTGGGAQTQVAEPEKLEPLMVETVQKDNLVELAKGLTARVVAENNGERAEVVNSLIVALRNERDSTKVKRATKTIDEVIKDSINHSMAELQATKVKVAGISLTIAQIASIAEATTPNPMKKSVTEFMEKYGIKIVSEKMKSKGKATKFLRSKDYEPEVKEAANTQTADDQAKAS